MAEPTLETALDKIIGRMKDPYFLAAIAAGILLVLIALAGPDGGEVYALVLAGLFFAFAVLRTVFELRSGRGDTGGPWPERDADGNVIAASDRATIARNEMSAGGGSNRINASGKARVRNNRMTTGRAPRKR